MKKIVFFSLASILLSCASPQEEQQPIMVQYLEADARSLLHTEIFSKVELVFLHGESAPIITPRANLIVQNGIYYFHDPNHSKVCLFDQNGRYLNSVGEKGRGSGEYLDFTDWTLEENGDISIYNGFGGLYTYTPQSQFIRLTEYPYKSPHFTKFANQQYHYFGHGFNRSFQLYITDGQMEAVDSCFTAYPIMPFFSSAPRFTQHGGSLYFCPPFGSEIYRFTARDHRPQLAYDFDFNTFALPDNFFKQEGVRASAEFLSDKTIALKEAFFEGDHHAVLVARILNIMTAKPNRTLYGILDKKDQQWHWFYMKEGDYMNFLHVKYLDDTTLYLLAEPALLKEAGLARRFTELDKLSDDDNVVILKCIIDKGRL